MSRDDDAAAAAAAVASAAAAPRCRRSSRLVLISVVGTMLNFTDHVCLSDCGITITTSSLVIILIAGFYMMTLLTVVFDVLSSGLLG